METVLPGFVRVVRFELGFGKNGLGRESRKAPQGVELDDAAACLGSGPRDEGSP